MNAKSRLTILLAAGLGLYSMSAASAFADGAAATTSPTAQPAVAAITGDELKTLDASDLQYIQQVDLDNLAQLVDAKQQLPGTAQDITNIITGTCSNPAAATTDNLALTAAFFTMFPPDHNSRGLGSMADDFHNAVVHLKVHPEAAPAVAPKSAPKPVVDNVVKPSNVSDTAGPIHAQLAEYRTFDQRARSTTYASFAYDSENGLGVVKAQGPFGTIPILDIYKPAGSLTQKERADKVADRINTVNKKIDHWWLNLSVAQRPVAGGNSLAWVVEFQNPENVPGVPEFLVQADTDSAASLGMSPEQFANYLKSTVQESVHAKFRDYDDKTDDQIQADPNAKINLAAKLADDANDVYQQYVTAKAAGTGDSYTQDHLDTLWTRYTDEVSHAIELAPNAQYYKTFMDNCVAQKDTHPALKIFAKAVNDPTITPDVKAQVEGYIQALNQ